MKFIVVIFMIGAIAHFPKAYSQNKLPTNFVPTSYQLNITTKLENEFTFEGVVNINVKCNNISDTITLNSINLNIDTNSVKIINKHNIFKTSVSFDPKNELMFIKTSEMLKINSEYTVIISFNGNLSSDLIGYYKNSYIDKDTQKTKWIAVADFEPQYAAQAFPCFNDPSMKATFKIILIHHKSYNAYSNMELLNSKPSSTIPDYVISEFDVTPVMSSYTVSYVVAPFEYKETNCCDSRVKLRILGRKDVVGQMNFALELAPKALHFFEDYLQSKFPLSKQDLVAIPDSYSLSADNWGLTLYNENELLIDQEKSSVSDILEVIDVITHEMGNQWFGNMVTMKKWKDIWLQEGISQYLGYRAAEFIYPKAQILNDEVVFSFINTLSDSLESSQPIKVDNESIENGLNVEQYFNQATFTKSSLLIRGINMVLGEETFQAGLRNYIDKYKFSSVNENNFWSVLTVEAHKSGSLDKKLTVQTIMKEWINQPGYPVLNVTVNRNTGNVQLTQQRYLAKQLSSTKKQMCWNLPITWTSSTKSDFTIRNKTDFLYCGNVGPTIKLEKDDKWIILNLQLSALCRVLYDTENWVAITNTLVNPNTFQSIHQLSRVQLITDSLSFAQFGYMEYSVTFELLNYLVLEKDFLPWNALLKSVKSLNLLLRRTKSYNTFKSYMQCLLSSIYKKFHDMNTEEREFADRHFKKILLTDSCRFGIKGCIEQSKCLFKILTNHKDHKLPIDMRPIIMRNGVKHGNKNNWNKLWKHYLSSNVASEKYEAIIALSCSSDTKILNSFLSRTIEKDSPILTTHAFLAFYSMATDENSNSINGFNVAKSFLYNKFAEISTYYGSLGSTVLIQYVDVIARQLNTKEELIEFKNFVSNSSAYLNESMLMINQFIETINDNILWTSKYNPHIFKYMKCPINL